MGPLRILVLGHTACGAIKGATKTYLASKFRGSLPPANKALDALLDGLSVVAHSAEQELGNEATEEKITALAVRKMPGFAFKIAFWGHFELVLRRSRPFWSAKKRRSSGV